MYNEFFNIIRIVEKMKKDTKKKGIGPKKIKQAYEKMATLKKQIKTFNAIIYMVQHASNTLESSGRDLVYMNMYIVDFISYTLNIQRLIQIFIENKKRVPKKINNDNFLKIRHITELKSLIPALKKMSQDVEVEFISTQAIQQGKNIVLHLDDTFKNLNNIIHYANSISNYNHDSVNEIANTINTYLEDIIKNFTAIQNNVIWHALDVYLVAYELHKNKSIDIH